MDDLSDMCEGKKQHLYCGGVVKPRRWRETRNRLTHKQSAHRATQEVVELGRAGKGERGPEGRPLVLAPHKANSRARELEHKYRPPLCLKPTFQISRCQDLVQK
jgi:hypothetical protein